VTEPSPTTTTQRLLVVGLGNDLLADDAVGVLAARELETRLAGRADVVATSLHGVALLEVFLGYERAIVIDAIQTGEHAPGTVVEIDTSTLRPIAAPSPHYVGLPEMLGIAEQLGVEFPKAVRVFAVEVADPHTIGGPMTAGVRSAIAEVCRQVEAAVAELEAT
jgi:hydrogenase maturation protease